MWILFGNCLILKDEEKDVDECIMMLISSLASSSQGFSRSL